MHQWLTSKTAFKIQLPQSQDQPCENTLQDGMELGIDQEVWTNTLCTLKDVEPGLSRQKTSVKGL